MKRILFVTAFALGLIACSSQSKNMVSNGELVIKGGVSKVKSWNDSLVFKRYSWFKEMNLLYEVLLMKIDLNSPFKSWYSESELKQISQCQDALVVLNYQLDSKRISHGMFKEQMTSAGYEEFALETFGSNLRLHPDFESLSLKLHKIHGFCKKSGGALDAELMINFPGFQSVQL